jgi:hypothetical protein
MPETRIEAANEQELQWVAEHVELAGFLIAERFSPDIETPGVDELDALWAALLAEPDPAIDANLLINAVGFAFGQQLVDNLGVRWAVVTDEHGTEIAVHEPRGDLLLFPPNLVGKRWQSRETGFLRPVYDDVAAKLAELRGQSGSLS